jgi:hypothetical protein
MSRVLMDTSLPDKLRAASDVLEVMDEAGRVLGVYTPTGVPASPPAGWQRPAPGLLKGQIVHMAEDFDAPLDDLREYME